MTCLSGSVFGMNPDPLPESCEPRNSPFILKKTIYLTFRYPAIEIRQNVYFAFTFRKPVVSK